MQRGKNVDRTIIRFVTIHAFDRWTDRQTDRQSTTARMRSQSHGKNLLDDGLSNDQRDQSDTVKNKQ